MSSGLFGEVKTNNQIGQFANWGPQFRISFDLRINDHKLGKRGKSYFSVLSFRWETERRNFWDYPGILFNARKKLLLFKMSQFGKMREAEYSYFYSVKMGKWYTIAVEQTLGKDKVRKENA